MKRTKYQLMSIPCSIITCLLHFPRGYVDLCLLTGADEIGPIQRLTSGLTIERFIRENASSQISESTQLFQLFVESYKVDLIRQRELNRQFYAKALALVASGADSDIEKELINRWYIDLWKGVRREIELNVPCGTQILFRSEGVSLDDFLQYFLNHLSIGALAGSEQLEVKLSMHCFMTGEL